jgi:hypothetical protein
VLRPASVTAVRLAVGDGLDALLSDVCFGRAMACEDS